jgi:isopenicillin N synthase-like dioxygenase
MDKSSTAYLQTLSFAKLAGKDVGELAKLLEACQQQGFFYLDLAGSDAAQALEDRLQALSLTKEWFDRPMEEKMKLRQDSVTKGFVTFCNIVRKFQHMLTRRSGISPSAPFRES